MSNDEATRLYTRKTCEVPPAFVSLEERERKERERGTERRAEHTANKDWDPPDASRLRPEHTLAERPHCSLWQARQSFQANIHLQKDYPQSYVPSQRFELHQPVMEPKNQPVAFRHIYTPSLQKKKMILAALPYQ